MHYTKVVISIKKLPLIQVVALVCLESKNKSLAKEKNPRQVDNCAAFYDKNNTTAVRDFRYARNQVQKAKRAKKRIEKLEKLMGKAATAFLDGAALYKDCSDPRARALYEGLR